MMTDMDIHHFEPPRYRKYPFPTMRPGDMFHVEPESVAQVRWAASQYGRRHGVTFSVLKYEKGTGCWRID